jgi:hypothetical protein
MAVSSRWASKEKYPHRTDVHTDEGAPVLSPPSSSSLLHAPSHSFCNGTPHPTPTPTPALTPAPTDKHRFTRSLGLLCTICALRSVADRSWAFILPIYLASADSSTLAPTAILSAVQAIAVAAFSPGVARLFDAPDRRRAFVQLMVVENVAVVLGATALLAAGAGSVSATINGSVAASITPGLLHSPMYWIGVALMAVDAVCSSILSVVVEKDWVATISHGTSEHLVQANAWVARLDLGVSVLSYMVLGQLMPVCTASAMLVLLGGWHVLVAGVMVRIINTLCDAEPSIRWTEAVGPSRTDNTDDLKSSNTRSAGGAATGANGVADGFRCVIFYFIIIIIIIIILFFFFFFFFFAIFFLQCLFLCGSSNGAPCVIATRMACVYCAVGARTLLE